MAKLSELAKVIRSKNSGPYEITFDIMFPDPDSYQKVKNSHVLNAELIKKQYSVTDQQIKACMFFEPALAFKFTIQRSRKSEQGSINEHDTFGTQQHAPLLEIEIPD